MKKSLISLIALMFVFSVGIAQAAQHEKPSDAVVAACKGKKPGDEVKVDGKTVKCPKAMKKPAAKEPAAPAPAK
jgi:hypothetical protein